MVDFFKVKLASRKGVKVVKPSFIVSADISDILIKGKAFYAVWDEEHQIWSRNEMLVQKIVDKALDKFAANYPSSEDDPLIVDYLNDFDNNQWSVFKRYLTMMVDSEPILDSEITFKNSHVTKEDYRSRMVPYSLVEGDYSAWDELVGTYMTRRREGRSNGQ